jgi:hypothetical protein
MTVSFFCFAYIESECFCDSIIGYDAETVRILEIPEEDKHICTGNRKSARVEIRHRDTDTGQMVNSFQGINSQ